MELAVRGSGVWPEGSTPEPSGYLAMGNVRYGTLVPKIYRSIDMAGMIGADSTFTVKILDEMERTYYQVRMDAATGIFPTLMLDLTRTFAWVRPIGFIAASTSDPVLNLLQLRAMPTPGRNRQVRFPLRCDDVGQDASGNRFGYEGFAWDRLQALEALEESQTAITVVDHRTGETFTGTIYEIQCHNVVAPDRKYQNFGGHNCDLHEAGVKTQHELNGTIYMNRKTIVGIFATLGMILALMFTAMPSNALGKVKCDSNNQPTVSLGWYDPIVNHNDPGPSMHEHQFFGNIAWHSLGNPNTANYSDLEGKTNNCRKVLGLSYSADSAGYWVPTLRYKSGRTAGKLVPAQQFTAYYRAFDGSTFGPGMAYPADTRLVATDDFGPGAHGWSCGQNSGTGATQAIPDCSAFSGKPGYTLSAHITFPSCWDGVLPNHSASDAGNTNDNAHYAYPKKGVCPAGFPNKMTQLRETIQFAYTGKGTDVELSSDRMAGTTDGLSMHADFWNTWAQPEFEQFIRDCVNSNANFASAKCQP